MNISVNSFPELCKLRISVFSALSTVTGFLLIHFDFTTELLAAVSGVFFLACGSCALNQYQERDIDTIMERTKIRPLPQGKITPGTALCCSLLLICAGLAILTQVGKPSVIFLGCFAVLWYNGMYTSLKRKTAFAAVPGALLGTVPPLIGWIAGGGKPFDYQVAALCFFFYMWQVPHFWLLQLSNDSDYKKAGLPSLLKILSGAQLTRITVIWILAAGTSCLLLPLYMASLSHLSNFFLLAITVWLMWKGVGLFSPQRSTLMYTLAFHRINTYMLLVMILLNINGSLY
jgi:protoheme IX farnesyltransferase